jgi:hypothetical protein
LRVFYFHKDLVDLFRQFFGELYSSILIASYFFMKLSVNLFLKFLEKLVVFFCGVNICIFIQLSGSVRVVFYYFWTNFSSSWYFLTLLNIIYYSKQEKGSFEKYQKISNKPNEDLENPLPFIIFFISYSLIYYFFSIY